MKKSILLLLVFVCIAAITLVSCSKGRTETIKNANGTKIVIQYDENNIMRKKTITGDKEYKTIIEYDHYGTEIERSDYNHGKLYMWSKYENTYLNDKLIEQKTYFTQGLVSVTEYDSSGNLTKSTKYDMNGNRESITEYDSSGNKTKKTSFDSQGRAQHTYIYDSKGNTIAYADYKYYWYDSTKLFSIIEYNVHGWMTKKTEYDDRDMSYTVSEYDSRGNRIKVTLYNADGTIQSEQTY